MDFSASNRFDIFEIYRRYCEATSGAFACGEDGYRQDEVSQKSEMSREALSQLLKFVESKMHARVQIFDEVSKLMARLNLMVDSYEFSRFYNFVFFICRENGQKSITVTRAVTAWRLVLSGRFRLLNQWCNFVEKNQQHNISEDTWRQVLAFSRCVHENLEGYDPEGAWPVLIDEFVEHMYRSMGSSDTLNLLCNCGDSEAQLIDDSFPGLKILPGLKRKLSEDFEHEEFEASNKLANFSNILISKRRHINFVDNSVNGVEDLRGNAADDSMEIVKHSSSTLGCSKSPCGVEGCLSKGFAGLFSGRSCLQFDHERRVSYT